MVKVPIDDEDVHSAAIEEERANIQEFIKELSPDDIKSGGWFPKLCARALGSYTEKATWEYFAEKYKGVPADAIVDQRIKMASRYAAIEGGLSAGAYSAAIIATLGTLGGASPATVPASVATLMVDVVFLTQLQLRLAYDIAVLYRVPLDVEDPDDLWKLIRVALTIKGGEVGREGLAKLVPPLVRPVIKRFYSRGVLNAAKGLPFVGKFLLQRNVIKIGIPLVGVPLAVVVNRYSTLLAGRHAQKVFRNDARVVELADRLTTRSQHPQLMLWVAWLVIVADHKISDDEAQLIRHLMKFVRERHEFFDQQLAHTIEIDPSEVWQRLNDAEGDLGAILDMARLVALVDGEINALEQATITEIQDRIERKADVEADLA
ncbi:hypothetical protein [Citricoccus sp. GCM10030269]|uniref:tellurite resistance TerB family protein n=1 Tax=Citricoccus sp. GCM10030269 TaxID=3273388 RepID=UPI00360C4CE9